MTQTQLQHQIARLRRMFDPVTDGSPPDDAVALNGSSAIDDGPTRAEGSANDGAVLNGHDAHAAIGVLDGEAAVAEERAIRVRIDRSELGDRPIVMPSDTGPAAHAYRMLRTQLLQRARQQQVRTIGIVSAAEREGKTLTAINLALSLAAEPNQAVLLADLDLHRPSVASTLKLPLDCGLESWFAGRASTLAEVTYAVDGFERLSILPTLSGVPGSSEALAGARAQAMLAELRASSRDRLVLLDLPPLLLTDDFLMIAAHIDGVVVVAREGYTKRDDLTRVGEILGAVKVLGTVLNSSIQFERRAY